MQTGLIDPSDLSSTTLNAQGVNTVETIYKLQHSTSTFKGGKFTQELTGSWVTYDAAQEQVARANKKKATAQARNANQSDAETARLKKQNADAAPLPYGPRAPGGLGTARQSPNNNLGTTPLNPDVKNAPEPAPGQGVSGPLDRLNKQVAPNSNPGQVRNREP